MVLKRIVLLMLLFVVSLVFYFSWLPSPNFKTETYLPRWILEWSNYYYNLRTAIPFIILGFLLEIYNEYFVTNKESQNKKMNFIKNICIATIIVCIAEGGQFFIKKRNPDLMDVFFGILGSFSGWLGYYLLKKVINFKSIRNAE